MLYNAMPKMEAKCLNWTILLFSSSYHFFFVCLCVCACMCVSCPADDPADGSELSHIQQLEVHSDSDDLSTGSNDSDETSPI